MSKISNSKTVTMRGGKNVAGGSPPRQKPPKANATEPEEKNPTPHPKQEKPTE